MAQALECPACGTRHRVERLPDTPTFRCTSCGQTLRVPSQARESSRAASGGGAGIAPPPRRRPDGGAPAPVPAATVTATVPARGTASDAGSGAGAAEGPEPRRRRPPAAAGERARVRWWWRLLAWVVAVPLGLVITAISAYDLGWIKKNDLLDVFIGSGTGRYTHLAVGTVVWALVTALLVQLFVEGGRWVADRRRAARPEGGEPAAGDEAPLPPERARSTVDVSR